MVVCAVKVASRMKGCSTPYGLYISQLIRFARVFSHVTDFNARNKLLHQGYQYHKLRKAFSKFYRRHYELCPPPSPAKVREDILVSGWIPLE